MPPSDAGRCRTGSNPPPVAPHLHDARPPPLQPRCGADMPVVARHTPLQPLHSTAASEPSMQQLPADGWTHALVRPQAGLALPPANRRPKRGAAGPAEAEPPKQAAKCANTPPSSPARSQLSPGMVPCRTSRSALPLRALPRLELPADCALHVAIAGGKATVVLVKPGHPFATAEIGSHALLSGGETGMAAWEPPTGGQGRCRPRARPGGRHRRCNHRCPRRRHRLPRGSGTSPCRRA